MLRVWELKKVTLARVELVKFVQKQIKKIFYAHKMRAAQSDCMITCTILGTVLFVLYCTVLYCTGAWYNILKLLSFVIVGLR